jgi:HSP20 family protein
MDRLTRYRPSNTLRGLQSEVNRLFEDLFPSQQEGNGSRAFENAVWSPQIDVLETNDHYRLRVDLPGIQRDDVTINAEGQRLTIRGERQDEARHEDESMLRTERMHGRFYRAMTLPTEVNPDKAKAKFENGVLVVDLPKISKNKAKSITIS